MDNKLITDLSRVFDYRYVDENEYNFKLISDMLTDFNFSLEYHRNKEVFAHNGEQIKYEHLNVTSSVSDFLTYLNGRFSNMVLGHNGDGINEVKTRVLIILVMIIRHCKIVCIMIIQH